MTFEIPNYFLADLGPDAEFSQFSPHIDGTRVEQSEVGTDVRSPDTAPGREDSGLKTHALGGMQPKASPEPAPKERRRQSLPKEIDEALHNAPTLILDLGSRRN